MKEEEEEEESGKYTNEVKTAIEEYLNQRATDRFVDALIGLFIGGTIVGMVFWLWD